MFTRAAAALPHKQRKLHGRTLVVVDMENMTGGGVQRLEDASEAWAEIISSAGLGGDEQVVIGVSHFSLLAAGLAVPGAGLRVRSGQDGADLALIEMLDSERVADRFDGLVLASGDGIFAEVVSHLVALGLFVTVVAREGHVARKLRMCASRVVLLSEPHVGLGDAA